MSFTADSKESATAMISNFSPNGKSLDTNAHQVLAHPLQPSQSSRSVAVQISVCFGLCFIKSINCAWEAIKLWSKSGGGARIWIELGTWVHPEAQHLVVGFNVWIKTQMSQENFDLNAGQMRVLAAEIRDRLHQHSICFEVDNCIEFL